MEASRRAPSRVVVDQVGVVDLYERGRVRHGTQRHRLTCGMHIPSCARTDQQQSRACRRASRGALSGSFSSHWTSWCPTSLLRFLNLCRLSFNLVPPRERETRKDKTKEKRLERDQGVASSISHRPDLAGSARWRVGGNFPRQPKCGTGLPSRRWFEIRLTSAATAGAARAAHKRIALQPHVADSAARI